MSCGYLNPPGSSWCHRCGAGWLDRTEQPVDRVLGGPAELLGGLPPCGHAHPVESCASCRRAVAVDANLASAPARRRDVASGRQRAGLRRVASEEWRRKRPASVAVRAVTGAAIVLSAFSVSAIIVLNGGGSADRATRSSQTPAQEIKRGRSAAASVLAARRSTTTRSRVAAAPTATVSALAARQTTTTGSPAASAPTAALDAYWQNVKRHAFADAYSQLLPGSLNITEAQFVASEKQIKIQGASFRASVTSRTSSRATVVVGSLITRDQRYGCQIWSGSYGLIETAGRWRIARAAITPRPCVN